MRCTAEVRQKRSAAQAVSGKARRESAKAAFRQAFARTHPRLCPVDFAICTRDGRLLH
jgi:hypothetical protein